MKSASQYSSQVNADGTTVDVLAIEGYAPANLDASSPAYYGFVDAAGNWYIQRATTSSTVTTYEFVKGSSGYAAAWTGRVAQSYDIYSAIF